MAYYKILPIFFEGSFAKIPSQKSKLLGSIGK